MSICGASVRNVARWTATVGTFPLLIPVLAVAFIGHVLYKNLVPVPESPYNILPYVAAGWLVIGALLLVTRPRMARKMDGELSQPELADASGQEGTA